jgi:hypothetical protein
VHTCAVSYISKIADLVDRFLSEQEDESIRESGSTYIIPSKWIIDGLLENSVNFASSIDMPYANNNEQKQSQFISIWLIIVRLLSLDNKRRFFRLLLDFLIHNSKDNQNKRKICTYYCLKLCNKLTCLIQSHDTDPTPTYATYHEFAKSSKDNKLFTAKTYEIFITVIEH